MKKKWTCYLNGIIFQTLIYYRGVQLEKPAILISRLYLRVRRTYVANIRLDFH